MKIYANQLSAHLKKGLTPIYLISGDIPTLVQEAAQMIHIDAKRQGFSETLRYQIDAEFDWVQLHNILEHASLFQEKQYIELQATTLQLGVQGAELIKHYAECPQLDKLLVLMVPKLDAKTQKMPWVKHITDKGTHIPIWPLDFGKYIQWLQSKLKEKGLLIDGAGVRLLAEYTEGNYTSAAQTIEKLSLAYPKGKIGMEEIASLTTTAYQYDLFDWVDACLSGTTDRMIQMFYALKQAHLEPTLMLWAITQEIRKLIHLYFCHKQHLNLSEAFKLHGIWEKKQPLFQKALGRHDLQSLESLLEKAHQVDKVLKGAKSGNVWDALMDMGLQLSSTKRISQCA